MVRTFCIVATFAIILGSAALRAQESRPPAFHAIPTSPPANQQFRGAFSVSANGAALGVLFPPEVSGSTITVTFDFGCGFICPGGGHGIAYNNFTFAMPALPAGSYDVRFVDGANTIATFPLIVGGATPAAAAAPATSMFAAVALALLLLLAGVRRRNA